MRATKRANRGKRKEGTSLAGIGPMEKPPCMADSVYLTLRDAIVRGDLKPGQRLVEQKLSDGLGVSRVPVREAIKRLEQGGFVEKLPVRGTVVKEMSEEEIRDTFSTLAVLEGHAAARACEHASEGLIISMVTNIEAASDALQQGDNAGARNLDSLFHRTIVSAAGSEVLLALIEPLRSHVERYRRHLPHLAQYECSALEDHRALTEAVREKDEEKAESIVRAHILLERLYVLEDRTRPAADRKVRTTPPFEQGRARLVS